MSSRVKFLLMGTLILGSFGGLTVASRASCAGPHVVGGDNPEADYEETIISGERSSITGTGFRDGCNDDVGGCGDDEAEAYENVELSLKGPLGRTGLPGGQRVAELGRIDVESDGRFTHQFDVPMLPAGLYDVLDSSGDRVGSVRVVKPLP